MEYYKLIAKTIGDISSKNPKFHIDTKEVGV